MGMKIIDKPDEIIKKALDIQDIVNDYRQIESYLQAGKEIELHALINSVIQKHPIEAGAYNATRVPASNIEERALGCMSFLQGLLRVKGIQNVSGFLQKEIGKQEKC